MTRATRAKRPFHETVTEAIHSATAQQMRMLAGLIKDTKIPKGHDQITEAWVKRCAEMGWEDEDLGVSADLRVQKCAAEEQESQLRK